MAQKDIDGAKRILNTSTLAFRESFSEPIEVDSIVGMFCDKPVEGVVSTLKKASFPERIAPSTLSAETTRAAPTVPEPLNLDAPPRRLYMDAGREEIIEEILRLERKHIQEGLSYDRVRYLGDNTLSRRKEFLLDYLYSLCYHLESYQIGIHYLVERQAIQELKRIEEEKAKKRMSAGVQNFAPPITGQGKSRDLAKEKELDELIAQLRAVGRSHKIEWARGKNVPIKALLHASALWLSLDPDDWTAANDTIFQFTSPFGNKQLCYRRSDKVAIPQIGG